MRSIADIALKTSIAASAAVIVFAIAFKTETENPSRPLEENKAARLLFVGDVMLDRTIRTVGESRGYESVFSCIGEYLEGFDLVVANLEGPITGHPSKSRGTKPGEPGNTSFTFSPAVLPVLAANGILAVHGGNNHILDLGWQGAADTAVLLESAGISHFGIPGQKLAATTTVQGIRIGLASYNQFLGLSDPAPTIEALRSLKLENDFVVVFAHWGEEYALETEFQKRLAREFVAAGADLVVGSHPHVIQGKESIGESRIYYSLGNFVFDQYWNEDVSTGLGVEVIVDSNEASFNEAFFSLRRDGSTCLKMSVDNR